MEEAEEEGVTAATTAPSNLFENMSSSALAALQIILDQTGLNDKAGMELLARLQPDDQR